eukprot:SAG22_NODE_530_length_9427_cov_3.306818_2_plen_139_part_00
MTRSCADHDRLWRMHQMSEAELTLEHHALVDEHSQLLDQHADRITQHHALVENGETEQAEKLMAQIENLQDREHATAELCKQCTGIMSNRQAILKPQRTPERSIPDGAKMLGRAHDDSSSLPVNRKATLPDRPRATGS